MKKYICDRCGEGIDTNIRYGAWPGMDKVWNIEYNNVFSRDIRGYKTERLDLCFDCYMKYSERIKSWLEEKNVPKKDDSMFFNSPLVEYIEDDHASQMDIIKYLNKEGKK